MRKLLSIQFLILASLFFTSCGQGALSDGVVKSSIVGGDAVKDFNEFPFIVSLSGIYAKDINDPRTYKEVKGYCGGTLVNSQWVVTAAHCLSVIPTYITTGALSKNGFKAVAKVTKIVVHPEFTVNEMGLPINDITMLKIEEVPEIESMDFDRISMDDPSSTVATTGTMATIMGWGAKCEGVFCQMSTPDKLQSVQVPIVENSDAMVKESYGENFDETAMLAAGYKEGGKDACQGDSGGPLFVQNGDSAVLVGVVSAGAGCARANYYGLYAKVSTFNDWMYEVMDKFSQDEEVVIAETTAQ